MGPEPTFSKVFLKNESYFCWIFSPNCFFYMIGGSIESIKLNQLYRKQILKEIDFWDHLTTR